MSTRVQIPMKTSSKRAMSFAPAPSGILQRKCACTGSGGKCEDCKKKETTVQRSARGQSSPAAVPPIVHEVLRSPGQPLDATTRAFFEPQFGHDFGRVRVHTDARAADSATEISALAYAAGRKIVFGHGQYRPETSRGRQLLAHELTHVVQQEGSSQSPPLRLGNTSDPCEREAGSVAAESMDAAAAVPVGQASGLIQRQTPPSPSPTASPVTAPAGEDPYCLHTRPGQGPERCDFTQKQQQTLSSVSYAAQSLTSQAVMNLSRGDPYMATLARNVLHVKDPDMNHIRSTATQILSNLRSKPTMCGTCADEVCYPAGVVAHVTPDLSTVILCQRFFQTSGTQMRNTLIHEAGHSAGVDSSLGNEPENYCPENSEGCVDPCPNLTGDLTRNVDAWAHFIECAAHSG